jgi:Uma2 family endonuclease
MGLPQRVAVLTSEEYLTIERAATFKSEFYRGEMFAMSGGTPKHSRINTNVIGELNTRLKGRPCVPYESNLRIKCATGLYTYPDASVVCGELEFDDQRKDTVLNPTLIVEVLSKSTEAYDRGKKFDHYRTIPSLREYLLVSQGEPTIQRFLRNDDGSWTLTAVTGLEQSLMLRSIDVELPLSEVFDRVDFTPDADNDEAAPPPE